MKTKITSALLSLVLFVGSKNVNAQLTLDWFTASTELNSNSSAFIKMLRDNSDNVFVLTQLSLTKFNSSGSQLWSVADTGITDMLLDNSGNAYVTFTSGYFPPDYDYKVHTVKYDVYGVLQWEQVLGNTVDQFGFSKLGIDQSGNIIMACDWGHVNYDVYPSCLNSSLYIVKYNSSGDPQWSYAYPGLGINGCYSAFFIDVTLDQYGNIYLSYQNGQGGQYNLLKVDGGGEFQFNSLIGTPVGGGGGIFGLVYDQGTASLFTYRAEYPGNYFFEKINASNGNITWLDSIITNVTWATSCKLDGLGNVYFAIAEGNAPIVKKYSTAGIFQFDFPYGTGFDIDGTGNIFVMEPYGNIIKKYSNSGSLLWSYSDPLHSIWTPATGLNNAPMVLNPNNKIYVIASDNTSVGLAKYSPCTLPTISISAGSSTTFCKGDKVKLTANASSGSTYQWQRDGTDISGATKKTYTAKEGGAYQCIATKSCGPKTSNSISVTVLAQPASKITNSSPVNICAGQTATLHAKTCNGCTYRWQKNNVNITGATNSTYGATQASSYTVITTNSSNCSKTSKACVVNITCKLANVIAEQFNIYPNPAHDQITIEFDSSSENRTIELLDLIGRNVYHTTMKPSSKNIDINVSDKPAGSYLLRIITDGGCVTRKIEILH